MINVISGTKTGTTARLLRAKLAAHPQVQGVVNWSGRNQRGALNALATTQKYNQLTRLRAGGVAVPDAVLTLPQYPYTAPKPGYLGRTFFHWGGRDFRRRLRFDFWTEPLELTQEWRLHVFRSKKDNMRVIRAARKVPKEGVTPHPWVRNHDYGWKFSYNAEGLVEQLREEARKAIRVLNLDFGAVDLGLTPEGNPMVLEVNTCPGLDEGATLLKYVENIVERLTP